MLIFAHDIVVTSIGSCAVRSVQLSHKLTSHLELNTKSELFLFETLALVLVATKQL